MHELLFSSVFHPQRVEDLDPSTTAWKKIIGPESNIIVYNPISHLSHKYNTHNSKFKHISAWPRPQTLAGESFVLLELAHHGARLELCAFAGTPIASASVSRADECRIGTVPLIAARLGSV
jgi:hypothetical protein